MKPRCAFCLAWLFLVNLGSVAHARLGGFEPADGYTINQIPGSPPSDFIDVTYYNAGQFGANAGGGSVAPIAYNSGAWTLNSDPGAFFANSVTRNSFVSSAPPYPSYPFSSTFPLYIVGNHFGGRTGTALALRNESLPFGAIEYDYQLDAFDFGGVNPATVTSGVVSTGFFFCPNPTDTTTSDKFIMSFVDSSGNIGLQLGYARDNSIFWRPGSSGAWTYPGIIADSTNYDGFTVDIDLGADTFALEYFDFSANTDIVLAAAGTPLGASMQDLTHLGWWLDDQVTGGIGGKNFFDDFSFQVIAVPEPASIAIWSLIGLGLAGFGFYRTRRKKQNVSTSSDNTPAILRLVAEE